MTRINPVLETLPSVGVYALQVGWAAQAKQAPLRRWPPISQTEETLTNPWCGCFQSSLSVWIAVTRNLLRRKLKYVSLLKASPRRVNLELSPISH